MTGVKHLRSTKNGCMSSGGRTKHTNALYFMIADRIEKGEVQLAYCMTKYMWADVLDKPR